LQCSLIHRARLARRNSVVVWSFITAIIPSMTKM
jgi:hypothetical protein